MKLTITPTVWESLEKKQPHFYEPAGEVIYVAGPYRAQRAGQIYDNIAKARTVAIHFWQKGYTVICPHLNSAFFDGHVSDDRFLSGDLELLRRSDLVVVLDGWRTSTGARAEVRLALKLNKPILGEDGHVLSPQEVFFEG